MRQAPCPKCATRVSLEDYEIEIVNAARTSMVTIAHSRGLTCLCGAYLLPVIVKASVDVGFVLAEPPLDAKKVIGVGALPFPLRPN